MRNFGNSAGIAIYLEKDTLEAPLEVSVHARNQAQLLVAAPQPGTIWDRRGGVTG